jgi:hypothetical protein
MTAYLPTRKGTLSSAPPARSQREPTPALVSPASIVERAASILARETAVTRLSLSPSSIIEAVQSSLPWRRSAAAAPGTRTTVSISLENLDDQPVQLTFHVSDFIADQGNRIPGSAVSFNPPTQTIPPHGRAKVDIDIAVPLRTPPGCYSGLVQGDGLSDVKAVLSVEVI